MNYGGSGTYWLGEYLSICVEKESGDFRVMDIKSWRQIIIVTHLISLMFIPLINSGN